jgi:phosphohistidine phosphatase
MNLYLLRHGLAVERTIPEFKLDSDRPLTPDGRKKLKRLGAVLAHAEISFDLILTSPYVRARQTAEIMANALGSEKRVEISGHLAPGNHLKGLVEDLKRRTQPLNDVLLVGHEPDLSRTTSILVTGKPGLPLEFKKGGLCKLEIATLLHGPCAALQWLVTPRLYAALT